ncbi:hypothetical protein [Spirosoma endbachense]|uniref:Uncharacterized protein n=1 Tax=Spirosoma endbachense TaxID=2666025 RepID=A0A6P1VTL6_9BACT|nr:hypothetical protein [Spirosoma endbachense]QHV94949.1 hypothetical protein GJR95_07910 [Spirosoma endbachense]
MSWVINPLHKTGIKHFPDGIGLLGQNRVECAEKSEKYPDSLPGIEAKSVYRVPDSKLPPNGVMMRVSPSKTTAF